MPGILSHELCYSEADIISAARAAAENGRRTFTTVDVQAVLLGASGINVRSALWMKKQDIIPGEKISWILRNKPELFRKSPMSGSRIRFCLVTGGNNASL